MEMSEINFDLVKKIRGETGAGIKLCKEALQKSDGDQEKAKKYIRKKGADKFSKRLNRATAEGVIGVYIHGVDQKTVALVELNCETDFVARNDDFRDLAHDLAMQVAAMSPKYVDKSSVPISVIRKEKKIIRDSDGLKGKPKKIIDEIIDGKLEKFYQENCLMQQKYFKKEDLSVEDLINEAIAKIGEKIVVSHIYRMIVGG